MMPEHLVSIRELSDKYDCSLRTLRFYEEIGFLQPHRRHQQRLYSAEDETRLKLIVYGKRLGLSLHEIRNLILSRMEEIAACEKEVETATPFLSREKIEHQIVQLAERRSEVDVAIGQLREAQLRLLSATEDEVGTNAAVA